MEINKIKEVIERAQAGNEEAREELVKMVKDNGAMQQINRYLYMNRLLEPEDVRGEFWYGVIRAIPKVKYDIGNPLQFLVWHGINQIRRSLTRVIGKNVSYVCLNCGKRGRVVRYEGKIICHKCKSEKLETYQIGIDVINENTITETMYQEEEVNLSLFIITLTEKERVVFDLIMSGIDRDNTNNYLKEIAEKMKVSPSRVNAHLQQIRIKLRSFLSNTKAEAKNTGETIPTLNTNIKPRTAKMITHSCPSGEQFPYIRAT